MRLLGERRPMLASHSREVDPFTNDDQSSARAIAGWPASTASMTSRGTIATLESARTSTLWSV